MHVRCRNASCRSAEIPLKPQADRATRIGSETGKTSHDPCDGLPCINDLGSPKVFIVS